MINNNHKPQDRSQETGMPALKRSAPTKPATTPKRAAPQARNLPQVTTPQPQIRSEIIDTVRLGDNREVRITKIQTGVGADLVRIGINLIPGGENMSGAVFPASYTKEVIAALRKAV